MSKPRAAARSRASSASRRSISRCAPFPSSPSSLSCLTCTSVIVLVPVVAFRRDSRVSFGLSVTTPAPPLTERSALPWRTSSTDRRCRQSPSHRRRFARTRRRRGRSAVGGGAADTVTDFGAGPGRAVVVGHCQRDRVGAVRGIGMTRGRTRAGGAVSEVPRIGGDCSVDVARGRAAEVHCPARCREDRDVGDGRDVRRRARVSGNGSVNCDESDRSRTAAGPSSRSWP